MSRFTITVESSLLVRDAEGHYLPATADQILEAARRVVDLKVQRGAPFNAPDIVKEYLGTKLAGLEHELFAVLFLDNQHRLIDYVEMFRGTIDSASVYPREVVKEALKRNAAAVILSHNHPSGHAEPSQADRTLTGRLKDALGLVDVRTLDHIIVAGPARVSFAELGLL
ncbi:RadC family protein [Stutzerimonas nitrititolerans]